MNYIMGGGGVCCLFVFCHMVALIGGVILTARDEIKTREDAACFDTPPVVKMEHVGSWWKRVIVAFSA